VEADEYDANCDGCKRSRGDSVTGGIVRLGNEWILNHYQGDEGFLGWMALQPRRHRCELAQLEPSELAILGENIQKIDSALQTYWQEHFSNDPIKRVYVVYFYESVYDKPKPTSFHLHMHLIPRTKLLDRLLRESPQPGSDPTTTSSTIVAWNIYRVTKYIDFPSEYRYDRRREEDKPKVYDLMNYLRSRLESPSA
jgi:diadenosine tetraphosphate (Ap4A) HIT family hydrolase